MGMCNLSEYPEEVMLTCMESSLNFFTVKQADIPWEGRGDSETGNDVTALLGIRCSHCVEEENLQDIALTGESISTKVCKLTHTAGICHLRRWL
jgi:hypothetical protein